jgi:hypothetical protein
LAPTATPLTLATTGLSSGTRGTISRGSYRKGKSRVRDRTRSGNRDRDRGSSPRSIISTNLSPYSLYNRIPYPSFIFYVKYITEAALCTPMDTIPLIKYNWDCVNSITYTLYKEESKTYF